MKYKLQVMHIIKHICMKRKTVRIEMIDVFLSFLPFMMALTSLLLSIVCKATNNSEGESGGFCAVPLVPIQINK